MKTERKTTAAGPADPTLEAIEKRTEAYASARDELDGCARRVAKEIAAVRERHIDELRDLVILAAKAERELLAELKAGPDLFRRPKSRILHGIKVGWKKQKGKITFDDAEAVVKRIRRHLPRKFKTLVKISETPIKDALGRLSVAEIKKLGVTVTDDTDIPFAAPVDSEVEKIVAALIDGALADGESK